MTWTTLIVLAVIIALFVLLRGPGGSGGSGCG
jgi:hypothetical protein